MFALPEEISVLEVLRAEVDLDLLSLQAQEIYYSLPVLGILEFLRAHIAERSSRERKESSLCVLLQQNELGSGELPLSLVLTPENA
jgi:hypothetical protein